MEAFTTIRDWLGRRAEELLALILASLFVTFLIQIVFRYFLNLPLGWTIEFVSIAWLWGILFGYAFVTRDQEIIRLDIVYGAVPVGAQRVMDGVTGLICTGIFLWSLPNVWEYVTFMKIEKTAYMRIPFDYVFSIYIPFAIAVSIRCLINVWQAIRGTHPKYAAGSGAEGHDYD
ncbi:TRAP transporter small permease subunit [Oricola sp.]|uniref:TRAP transporter small permease n=1 Tax=Oricola sp. TaxID=1979950 RepID=UPI0025CD42B6|nr:TRAP transporter small permease subunit [Oricola sp.]MCI5077340.1 TRAP transporter small permease subunit [Oricola sp.]